MAYWVPLAQIVDYLVNCDDFTRESRSKTQVAAIVHNIRGRSTNIGTGASSVRSFANLEYGCNGDRFGNSDFINR